MDGVTLVKGILSAQHHFNTPGHRAGSLSVLPGTLIVLKR